jgi:hypothetical protein
MVKVNYRWNWYLVCIPISYSHYKTETYDYITIKSSDGKCYLICIYLSKVLSSDRSFIPVLNSTKSDFSISNDRKIII